MRSGAGVFFQEDKIDTSLTSAEASPDGGDDQCQEKVDRDKKKTEVMPGGVGSEFFAATGELPGRGSAQKANVGELGAVADEKAITDDLEAHVGEGRGARIAGGRGVWVGAHVA